MADDRLRYGLVTQYTTVWEEMERITREELEPVFLGKCTAREMVTSLVPRINRLLEQAVFGAGG